MVLGEHEGFDDFNIFSISSEGTTDTDRERSLPSYFGVPNFGDFAKCTLRNPRHEKDPLQPDVLRLI